jgi:hypothetical protein
MASRGPKPKPAHLRLVDGTHRTTRHGNASKAREKVEEATASFGKLQMPSYVKGETAKIWKEIIAPAGWLDGSRVAAAHALCELIAEFRRKLSDFPAAKHGQIRAYLADLGLTDERNRGGEGDGKEKDPFFDD